VDVSHHFSSIQTPSTLAKQLIEHGGELCPLAMAANDADVPMVRAAISYVAGFPEHEKPYHMMYGDGEDFARTNITRAWLDTDIHDVRGREAALDFWQHGVAIRQLQSKMQYDDFDIDAKIRNIYFRELEDYLRQYLNAREVRFFRYGIRKRHAEFPVSTGKAYEFAQPTSIAHVDATIDSTVSEIMAQFGNGCHEITGRRFLWVNVWRPLRGPCNDWPLCFCDASSVESVDAEATDMVYPEYFTENVSLRFNQHHRWYYLSDHQPNEVIIFKQSDSESSAVGGVPHCSFLNPKASPSEPPRESIEARALVVY